jgi:hypothetical protein
LNHYQLVTCFSLRHHIFIVGRLVLKTVSAILLGIAVFSCCQPFLAAASEVPRCHNHSQPKSQAPVSHQCCLLASHSASVVSTYRFAQSLHGFDVPELANETRSQEQLFLSRSVATSPPNKTPLRI